MNSEDRRRISALLARWHTEVGRALDETRMRVPDEAYGGALMDAVISPSLLMLQALSRRIEEESHATDPQG